MASAITQFDPSDEKHVLWLQKVDNAMIGVTEQKKIHLDKIVNDTPFTCGKIDMVEWAFTHFHETMKRTGRLRSTARDISLPVIWKPPSPTKQITWRSGARRAPAIAAGTPIPIAPATAASCVLDIL